jgi:hypothetical protein
MHLHVQVPASDQLPAPRSSGSSAIRPKFFSLGEFFSPGEFFSLEGLQVFMQVGPHPGGSCNEFLLSRQQVNID